MCGPRKHKAYEEVVVVHMQNWGQQHTDDDGKKLMDDDLVDNFEA